MNTGSLLSSRSSIFALAVACCLLSAARASAQTRTVNGHFEGSAGARGGYTRTVTIASDGGRTILTVYTRHSDKATRTETTTTTAEDSQGGYTVDESSLDFGATAADTSHETVTRVKPGQHTATGTYTTASGDLGTLTSVESAVDGGTATSEVRVSYTLGTTQILRMERDGDDFVSVRSLTRAADGSMTSTNIVRYSGSATSATSATSSPSPSPSPTATPIPTPDIGG